jgi:hypothetical protein
MLVRFVLHTDTRLERACVTAVVGHWFRYAQARIQECKKSGGFFIQNSRFTYDHAAAMDMVPIVLPCGIAQGSDPKKKPCREFLVLAGNLTTLVSLCSPCAATQLLRRTLKAREQNAVHNLDENPYPSKIYRTIRWAACRFGILLWFGCLRFLAWHPSLAGHTSTRTNRHSW